MKKGLLIVISAFAILAMFLVSPYRKVQTQTVVELIYPEVRTIRDTVTLHGKIIDPFRKKLYASGTSQVLTVYVSEGEMVRAGQLLMRLRRSEPLESGQAAAAAALVTLKNALESGALSGAETLLQEMIDRAAVGSSSGAIGEVYELYSPCDGMVMEISTTPGEEVSSLLPCIEITDLKDLQLAVSAGESVVGLLEPQMTCSIHVPAFSMDDLQGTIDQIAPYAQETGLLTGTTTTETTVYIQPEGTLEALRPGYRASAKVTVSVRENAILLPYEAIAQDDNGEEYVLVEEHGYVIRKKIVTGAELESTVEICDGITPQDRIILHPKTEWEGEMISVALP